MTSKTKGPARTPAKCSLQAWFARSAPVAVLLRRGPSDWVRMIRWDLRDDSFEPGQWFHGAIATEQCDLSEDGELFLYLARREGRRYWSEDYGPQWTAVSRPPALHRTGAVDSLRIRGRWRFQRCSPGNAEHCPAS
ncbi:hypothetical protein [Metapseudomonas otitidis]|uniref:hypothetical protein n=1 Tax=Metapseudomonas otitidis TaxID=319939 RepID=UPI003671775C